MRYFKWFRKLIKGTKVITTICLSYSVLLSNTMPLMAQETSAYEYYEVGGGDKTYTILELLQHYENNSISYKRAMLEYQIQALGASIADENYGTMNQQYLKIIETIDKLKQTKEALVAYRNSILEGATTVSGEVISIPQEELSQNHGTVEESQDISDEVDDNDEREALIKELDEQISMIDAQLSQHNSSKLSLAVNLSDVQLSKDLANLYGDYQTILEAYAKKQLNYEFMRNCYSTMIYQEQINYSESYQTYLELQNKADEIKHKKGIMNQLTYEANQINIVKNNSKIREYTQLYDTQFSNIKKQTKIEQNSRISLEVGSLRKVYEPETTYTRFITNNPKYYEIKNYTRSYENYLGIGSKSYSTYQQTKLRIESYKMQQEELEGEIRAFVNNSIDKYNITFQLKDLSKMEVVHKNNLYLIALKKQEKGRASLIEVQEAFLEKEAANLEYYQRCYEVVLWQYILDHGIYGVTP